MNVISIYSSNLEEFYKIRVADHKAIATGAAQSDEETVQSTIELVDAINLEVNRQMEDRIRIYEQKILPALKKNHIIFYQSRNVEPFHRDFVRRFFREEIFPFLQPVPVSKVQGLIEDFLSQAYSLSCGSSSSFCLENQLSSGSCHLWTD